MTNALYLTRTILIWGACLALALTVGYQMATPDTAQSLTIVGAIFTVMFLPVFLLKHHFLLLATINAVSSIYFLPGQPQFWVLMAGGSFAVSFLRGALSKEQKSIQVKSVTLPLVLLTIVVIVTAQLRGGIGLKILGSGSFGGKYYISVLGAIMAYFALVAQPVAANRVHRYASIYFLSGITSILGIFAYFAGPAFYFLLYLFPIAATGSSDQANEIRFGGLGVAGAAFYFFLLQQYGLRELFRLDRPWRLAMVLGAGMAVLLGSFRTHLALIFLVTLFLIFLERGLNRAKILLGLLGGGTLVTILLIPFVEKLPFSVQRTLSMIPFMKVSSVAQMDAQSSSNWRFEMWKMLMPQVPQYLFLGKGYNIDPIDLALIGASIKRGYAAGFEEAMLTGDFHNGPLSLIIPFGLWGVLAFAWFLVAACKVMLKNHRYGEQRLQNINTFLLAFFLVRLVFFLFIFGGFYGDLIFFTSLVGLSISLNGGVSCPREPARKAATSAPALPTAKAALQLVPKRNPVSSG